MDVALLPLSPSLTREVATEVAKAFMAEFGFAVPKSDRSSVLVAEGVLGGDLSDALRSSCTSVWGVRVRSG